MTPEEQRISNLLHTDALSAHDTTFQNDVPEYLRIAALEGFHVVYQENFQDPRTKIDECLYVLWEPRRSILLHFDTYGGAHHHVNGGKFHYNVRPFGGPFFTERGITSSGHYKKMPDDTYVWVGNHDCREALRFHLKRLEANGTFLTQWVERENTLWLSHYMDWKCNYGSRGWLAQKQKFEERLRKLPEYVLAAITPPETGL